MRERQKSIKIPTHSAIIFFAVCVFALEMYGGNAQVREFNRFLRSNYRFIWHLRRDIRLD